MRLISLLWLTALGGIPLHAADAPVVERDSVVFKAEAKATNSATILSFDLGEPVIVRIDFEPKGDHYIRWRVRGGLEYESFENQTALAIGWKPGEYDAEFLYVQHEPFKVVEEFFVVKMNSARPPPDEPDSPLVPDRPVVKGEVVSYVLAIQAKLSIDESTLLSEIREWADDKGQTHYVFDPEAEDADGSRNSKVKKYYDLMSDGARYPYGFLVKPDGSIAWSGEIRSSASYIEKIGELNNGN